VGRDVFRHENWRGVVPAADPGRYEAPGSGAGAVPAFAVAHGHPAYRGALENRGDHWGVAALRRERRSLLGGADSAIGDSRATGSHGDAVDGDCKLAEAERAQTVGAGSVRNCIWLPGNGDTGWTGETGIVGPSKPDRRRSADRGVAGLGLRIALFEARDAAEFADAGCSDARIVRRRGFVGNGDFRRRTCAISSDGRSDAGVDGGWVSVFVRVVHRIYRVSLYFEGKHGSAGGNVRVRESDCCADHWMVVGRGGTFAKDPAGWGGDFDGGGVGDYGSASRLARGGVDVASSWESVTKISRDFIYLSADSG